MKNEKMNGEMTMKEALMAYGWCDVKGATASATKRMYAPRCAGKERILGYEAKNTTVLATEKETREFDRAYKKRLEDNANAELKAAFEKWQTKIKTGKEAMKVK